MAFVKGVCIHSFIRVYFGPVLNYKILNPLEHKKDATLTEPNADATFKTFLLIFFPPIQKLGNWNNISILTIVQSTKKLHFDRIC